MNRASTEPLPEGESKRQAVQTMFDTIAPRYDLVNRIMTFRMDVGIRQRTLDSLNLKPGSVVADLACGTGDFCLELVEREHYPVGVDLSLGMLFAARTKVPLVQGDLLSLPLADNSIDAAVCGYALRNLVELPRFFSELNRVVKPLGRIALVDVSEPENRFLKTGFGFYFNRVVPKVGALLSDKNAYSYLPRSVSYLPRTDELLRQIAEAGFSNVARKQLNVGIAQLFTGQAQ